jgi:hypothetical protein
MATAFTALGVGGVSRKAGEEPQQSEGLRRLLDVAGERMMRWRLMGWLGRTKSWEGPQQSESLRRSRGSSLSDYESAAVAWWSQVGSGRA